MPTLKSNIKKISGDSETLAKDYLKLFSVRQSEKLAIFLGIIMSIFVIATLVLILVIFCSFILSGALNKLLASEFWGFVIIGSLYLLAIIWLIVKIFRTSTPLFTNLFVRLIVLVMDIDTDHANNIKGLKKEQEHIKEKIETDKTKIEADFQILQYNIMGSIFNEILGFFTSKKKAKAEPEKDNEQEDESTKEEK
jgi:energy-coupling factor transporter transmembrane protein EcfT